LYTQLATREAIISKGLYVIVWGHKRRDERKEEGRKEDVYVWKKVD